MEILILLYLFDHHDLTVSGSHDDLVGVFHVEVSHRTLVEIKDDAIDNTKDEDEQPKRPFRVEAVPQGGSGGNDEDESVEQCVIAFTVYAYFL